MQPGVFARVFPGRDPQTVLGAVAAAGFDIAHYNMRCSGLPALPERIEHDVADELARAAEAHGVGICGISATFNMAHPDPGVRRHGLVALAAIARTAGDLGVPIVTLCTGTRDPDDMWRAHPDNGSPGAWRDLLVTLERAVEEAEAAGVTLGIEPERANVVGSAELARRLLDEMASDRFGVVLDPANLIDVTDLTDQHRTISNAVDLLADSIVMAHVKDRAPDGREVTPGTGVVDHDHAIAELTRAGFRGPVVAHGFAPEDAPTVARRLRERLGPTRVGRRPARNRLGDVSP